MTIPTFNAVGFCANYSKQGDWAFDFALQISQTHKVQLNVFHFLKDPYDPAGVYILLGVRGYDFFDDRFSHFSAIIIDGRPRRWPHPR